AGNMHTLTASSSDAAAMAWEKVYGGVVKLHGVFGVSRHVLLVSDPAALRCIFGSSSGQWDTSSGTLTSFRSMFGPGIAAVPGADHFRQRRVVSQALAPVQIGGMIDSVQAASRNMRNALQKACPGPPVQLDMRHWARKVALDSLTMFAFGVSLHAIDQPGKGHELLQTFDAMLEDCLGKTSQLRYFLRETALAGIHPSLLAITLTDPKFFISMIRTSKRLSQFNEWVFRAREEHGNLGSENNLVSLLESASKEDAKYKLADDEIRAHIGYGGYWSLNTINLCHDTVSTTFSMFLNDMGLYSEIQTRLRREIKAKRIEIGGEDATFTQEDYDSMPYLNASMPTDQESMRLNPALGQTFRTKRADDVLPLSKPMLGTDGKLHTQISVTKGTMVVINIASSNRRKDVWGDDAEDFNPGRWLSTEDKAITVPLAKTPGMVYGSILNFLAGSKLRFVSRRWRIAVLELQTFICDIIEGFHILPVPGDVIVREFHGVSIPKVDGRPVRGGEVPLMLEAVGFGTR
ncbi:cytochrome P450, partial [Mycena sanguinolenta]